MILLFDPPFDKRTLEPGLHQGLRAGRPRERRPVHPRGGLGRDGVRPLGDGDRAWELFDLLNPIHHARRAEEIAHVQGRALRGGGRRLRRPPHTGRGGWTWYTGSAGWMYRLIVESSWGCGWRWTTFASSRSCRRHGPAYKIHYRYRNTVHHLHFRNLGGGGRDVRRVTLNGVEQADKAIPLRDDGAHHSVEVDVGGTG